MSESPQDMSESPQKNSAPLTRREFFARAARFGLAGGVVAVTGAALTGAARQRGLWQIDPLKCVRCGRCRTACVLEESAVKCVHDFSMCGYCDLCTGFFYPDPNALNEGAENQLCPVGAIVREYVEEPFFEYSIDESLCTGCGLCVEGCTKYGNGSLYLQVRHNRCLGCNECAIAKACPADAFIRVPPEEPYLVKSDWIARQAARHTSRFPPPDFESGHQVPDFHDGLKEGGK